MNHHNKRKNMHHNFLFKHKKNSKHEIEFMGPFLMTQINDNGTVRFQKGIINDATNIRRIKPIIDWNIKTSQKFTFMISHTLIIGASAVTHVAL